MCQVIPRGLYTRWDFDTVLQKIKASLNCIRSFENLVSSFFFQETRPECKNEHFFTSGKQENSIVLMWTVFVITVIQCSKKFQSTIASVSVENVNLL